MRRDARRQAGFTLLEMLIALVIMGVLAVSVYSTLRISFRARKSALAAVGPARSAATALSLLRRDLESALQPKGLLAGEFVGEDEVGGGGLASDVLRFHTCSAVAELSYGDLQEPEEGTTMLSAYGGDPKPVGGDVQKIEFLLVEDKNTGDFNLVRNVTRNLLAQTEPEPLEQVICRDVVSFNIRYLDGSEWVDSWDSGQQEDALPPAVEVSLDLRWTEPSERSERSAGVGRSRSADELSRRDQPVKRVAVVFRLPSSGSATQEANQFIR